MQVEIFISGRKLKDLDTFSKSDPQCIIMEQRGKTWQKIGQTEQIKNSLNPDFTTSFTLAYFFEKIQNYKFVFIDGDGGGDFETIGEVQVTMGKLMGAKRQIWTENLTFEGRANRGQIIVRTQAIIQSNEVVKWRLKWQNVRNVEGGCLGMCGSTCFYNCEIQKEVPGAANSFVTAVKVPG